jgi:hypothetical protein
LALSIRRSLWRSALPSSRSRIIHSKLPLPAGL